jgi:hypothetical protein
MLIPLVLTAIVALIALAFWLRYVGKRKRTRTAPVRVPKHAPGNFHCVELRYPSDACDAVKRIGEMRFLSGEAPQIPLPGCDAAHCSCRYVHHKDRRHQDRRNPVAYQGQGSSGGERRTKKDRRRPAKTPFRPKTGR